MPGRTLWYARPYEVFDNLSFIGTRIHSAWALTTSDGIIVIDTLYDYAVEGDVSPKTVSAGLGYRLPVGGNVAFRLDGRYSRYIVDDAGSNTLAFTFSIAGLFGQR